MRAQAREAFTCYFNYHLRNVAAGEILDGGLAQYAIETGCPVDQAEDGATPGGKRGGRRGSGTAIAGDSS